MYLLLQCLCFYAVLTTSNIVHANYTPTLNTVQSNTSNGPIVGRVVAVGVATVLMYSDRHALTDACSAHGYKLAARSPTKLKRLFWTIVFISGCTLSTFCMYRLFLRYISYPIDTAVKLSAGPIPFPGITICNINGYKVNTVKSMPMLATLLAAIDQVNPNATAAYQPSSTSTASTTTSTTVLSSRRKRSVCSSVATSNACITNYTKSNESCHELAIYQPSDFCTLPGQELHTGDLDGDDNCDLYCHGSDGYGNAILHGTSTAGVFDRTKDWKSAKSNQWCNLMSGAQLLLGDVNADGKSDLICVKSQLWLVAISKRDYKTGTHFSQTFDSGLSGRYLPSGVLVAGDINCDGSMDVQFMYGSTKGVYYGCPNGKLYTSPCASSGSGQAAPLPSCAPNWELAGEYCYLYSNASDYFTGVSHCTSKGGRLPIFPTKADLITFTNEYLPQHQTIPYYWVGLKRPSGNDPFTWIDDTEPEWDLQWYSDALTKQGAWCATGQLNNSFDAVDCMSTSAVVCQLELGQNLTCSKQSSDSSDQTSCEVQQQVLETSSCASRPGYMGPDCKTDINECCDPNACAKSENCFNYASSYVCVAAAEVATVAEQIRELAVDKYGKMDASAMSAVALDIFPFIVRYYPDATLKLATYELPDMVDYCMFDGQACSPQHQKLLLDPNYGNCFQYNINRTDKVFMQHAGETSGLSLVLNDLGSSSIVVGGVTGLKVVLHTAETPYFPDEGVNVPFGYKTEFLLNYELFEALGPPFGNCISKGDNTYLYNDYDYTVEGCIRSCFQLKFIKQCGCGHPNYPLLESYHYCNLTQICREDKFGFSTTRTLWPAASMPQMACHTNDSTCEERQRYKKAKINVFYTRLQSYHLMETPSYGAVSMLCDFGGEVGVGIGGSFVALVELLLIALSFVCHKND